MTLNYVGPAAAISAFLGIWIGHVSVRKIESISITIWLPTVIFAGLGLACEIASLTTTGMPLNAALGILGITFLFDAFELTRQQRRVIKGHAPAHPANPRHARILAEHPSATTLDLLKRDPVGRPVSTDEAVHLIAEH